MTLLTLFAMVFLYIWLGYPGILLTPIVEYVALIFFYVFLGAKALRDKPEYQPRIVATGAIACTVIMWLAFAMEVKAVLM